MSGLHGIVMHWSAGGAKASILDEAHYHYMVQQDGMIVHGVHTPEDNIHIVEGKYAAHTLSANTGRIGVALCGMAGAQESPFEKGRSPITAMQIDVFCGLVADLCHRYNIPVTRQTVLSHAEVQPTLGIKQRGKWDIAWLPHLAKPIDPVLAGDWLRTEINKHMEN